MAVTKAQQVELKKWSAEQALSLIGSINKKLDSPWIPDNEAFANLANTFYEYVK